MTAERAEAEAATVAMDALAKRGDMGSVQDDGWDSIPDLTSILAQADRDDIVVVMTEGERDGLAYDGGFPVFRTGLHLQGNIHRVDPKFAS
jgi:hypothetical protein